MTVKNLSQADFDKYKVDNGVMITSVKRYSKAEHQNLGKGLVITEVDKKTVKSVEDFEQKLEAKVGKAVLLKVVYSNGTTRLLGLDIPEE